MAGVYYCAQHGCDISGATALLLASMVLGPILIIGIIAEFMNGKGK